MRGNWPAKRDTAIALVEGETISAELSVGTSLIRGFTWTQRPAWTLLESADLLVVLDPRSSAEGGALRLLSFPEGDVVLRVPYVQELEDVLIQEGWTDLVVRTGPKLRWLRISAFGEVLLSKSVDLELSSVACAAITRGAPGGWCLGWRGGDLLAVPFDAKGAELRKAFQVAFAGGPGGHELRAGTTLRAAAWSDESASQLAVSWPDYRAGVGKLQVIDVSGEPHALWEGRPDPEVVDGNSLDQCEYGQALAFVPDADGDGAPDVLVTGPWNFITRVDLLSGRTGEALLRWTPGPFVSTGHSLSLSADYTRALVGGTDQRSYPENLAHEGQAHLLDIRTFEKLRTWKRARSSR